MDIELIEIIQASIRKWENPREPALNRCSFCMDASSRYMKSEMRSDDDCVYCRIDKTICDNGADDGLVSAYRAKNLVSGLIGALPNIQAHIVAKLRAMLIEAMK